MCGLLLGLLVPHPETVTWTGYWYNLGVSTAGNIVGGAIFVAGMYWIGSPKARALVCGLRMNIEPSANGQVKVEEMTPVGKSAVSFPTPAPDRIGLD